MKRLASIVLAIFVVFCVAVAGEQRAYAYVDPGSGLLVIQSAASVAAAVGYFFRRKLKALFGGKSSKPVVVEKATAEPAKRASGRLA
jgi:hypothetical protein